ncbi:MAG: DNA translocase FtsK, partial [Deltaproteobacteria bacterium]|nr:DNA translocase FtsK [Deltaproteobacteria bacterium]
MIDPKRIELSAYGDIPHLLYPVVTEPKKATKALGWAVGEMERRYVLLEEKRAKNIDKYNQNNDNPLPYIIIVIDELADLMLVSSHEVEGHITRLAQMARAAGIHLLVATQRPSVDVLTGVIKANFPTRISFQVSSKIDSRTILDTGGAENLLGAGDMLFLPPGTAKLQRIHGAYISEVEIMRVVDFLKGQKEPSYDETILEVKETEGEMEDGADYDEKYEEAVKLVLETRQASISMIQRRLRVGYNRAARMIETMEKEGIVGPADGSKPREVLVHKLG